jgi:hypothetical protein
MPKTLPEPWLRPSLTLLATARVLPQQCRARINLNTEVSLLRWLLPYFIIESPQALAT